MAKVKIPNPHHSDMASVLWLAALPVVTTINIYLAELLLLEYLLYNAAVHLLNGDILQ